MKSLSFISLLAGAWLCGACLTGCGKAARNQDVAQLLPDDAEQVSELLDGGQYIEVVTPDGRGVYNIATEEYEVYPTPRCSAIRKVNDSVWNMLNASGEPYREIKLTHEDNDSDDIPEVEPYLRVSAIRVDGNESYDFIRDIAEEFRCEIDEVDKREIERYKDDPTAYRVLGKIYYSSGCENTPVNNLLWHRVAHDIIDETGCDYDQMLQRIEENIGWLLSDTQYSMNIGAYMLLAITHLKQLDVLNATLEAHPEYRAEYERLSRMQAAMLSYYRELAYMTRSYSSLALDVSDGAMDLLNATTELLKLQQDVLDGHPVTVARAPKASENLHLTIYDDIVDPTDAYKEWLAGRRRFASTLTGRQRTDYDAITDAMAEIWN